MDAKIYTLFFNEIKNKIRAAQYAAMREVNIQLIHCIGKLAEGFLKSKNWVGGKVLCKNYQMNFCLNFQNHLDYSQQIFG